LLKFFKEYLKFRKLKKIQVEYFNRYQIENLDQDQIKCLAYGQWELFKRIHLPEHFIGMDSDAEAILDQHAFSELQKQGFKDDSTKPLELVSLKIKIAQNLAEDSKNIYRFFKEQDIYDAENKSKEVI